MGTLVEMKNLWNQHTVRCNRSTGAEMWNLRGEHKALGQTVERETEAAKTNRENAEKENT